VFESALTAIALEELEESVTLRQVDPPEQLPLSGSGSAQAVFAASNKPTEFDTIAAMETRRFKVYLLEGVQ